MNVNEFVKKWSQVRQKEISVAQSHFNDICALVHHRTPIDADPKGEFFTFEEPTEKIGGDKGRADVWYEGRFIWEYKGYHKNLDKAYQQLQLYRESLGNPPLLITSDTQKIIIHTNFTNTVKQVYIIDFDELLGGIGLEILKRAFHEPDSFKPDKTQEQVTRASADTFVEVADILNRWATVEGRQEDPEQLAHFIIRLLFSMFAEDLGVLPENVFTKLVGYKVGDIDHLSRGLQNLFAAMRSGGDYGHIPIPNFNGGLFDDEYVPNLPGDIHHKLRDAARQDWSAIDPSIFGTLFERIIDESKRAQLGAHYTSKEDMLLVIEPVLMQPLREEWQSVKQAANQLINAENQKEAFSVLETFSNKLAFTKVLDPACGSGNFLYVGLRQLLDLQKIVIVFAARNGLEEIPLTVSPSQLFGIELNQYAHELAQITVWIGYYQWRFENGFSDISEPILKPLHNIERKDAILQFGEQGELLNPAWPDVDVIIGNPPFLGDKKMKSELDNSYVDSLRKLFKDRIPGGSDLVCYWFEKARAAVEQEHAQRVGLLATQGIRGGSK